MSASMLDRISTRIALAGFVVGAVTLAIVAVGVMRVGGDTFAELMVAAGISAEHAHRMFDDSVAIVVVVAAAVGAVAGLAVAAVLARRIAGPIERLAETTAQVASGDRRLRATASGPAEIRALAAAYNELLDRLAEEEEIRREFVINASHELRTPLTNLQGYLEALRDGVLPPDPATFESLKEEVDRLSRLAASLDVLAGADVATPTEPVRLDLGAAVRSAIDLAAPGFARNSIEVRHQIATGVTVSARPDEVAQVLANLLQNAIRYTPTGGHVAVAVVAPIGGEGHATVRVANSGAEIPALDLPRVWERFYRVEKSRSREAGGAGIGLAIVKRLVEAAGGRVGATSDRDRTTFWFTLPTAS